MLINSNEFEIETWHDIKTRTHDLEFHIHYNGKKYFGWAFTLDGISQVLRKDSITGECAHGSYFWVEGLIILKEISEEILINTIDSLIAEGDSLDTIFCLLE